MPPSIGTYPNNIPQTFAVFNGANHVAALGAGVMVDGSSSLGTWQTMVPEFTGTTAFMGVEFHDASNNLLFGWIRINGGPTLAPVYELFQACFGVS